jgi:hypothetical protein
VSLFGRACDSEELVGVLAGTGIGGVVEGGEEVIFIAVAFLAGAEQGYGLAGVFANTSVEGFEEDAGEAGRERVAGEAVLHTSGGAEAVEEVFGVADGFERWRGEPVEVSGVSDFEDAEREAELGELGAFDFGGIVIGALGEVFFGVKAENVSGGGAPGSSGSLGG